MSKEFTRITSEEVAKYGVDYAWLNTRYDEMPDAERRADVAILEALFGTPSLREYLRTEYDIGVYVDHEDKRIAVAIQPRRASADGMVAVEDNVAMPRLSAIQRAEIRTLLNITASDPDRAYHAIMEALGQPKDDLVLVSGVNRNELDA